MASASEPAQSAMDSTSPQLRGLLRFSEAIAPEIFAFQRAAFPHRRDDWIEPRWRWMFEASAARLGVEPMVWVYRMKGRVVAHQGAIAVKLRTPVGEYVTGWFVETMALEEVRGKAVGSMVVAKALEDLPFNLSLGQTAQMRELQFRLGWQQVAPLNTLAFVLHGGALVAGKLPRGVATLAGAGLTLYQRARHWMGRRRPASRLQVRELPRFSDAHDRLWRRIEKHYPVAVVRDASYLNWKYVDQPGQTFVRLELTDGEDVRAIAVISIAEPDATYRYRRAWLTDLVVPPEDPAVTWETFEAVRTTSLRLGADLIIFDVISEPLVRSALSFGFVRREPARVLLIAPGAPPSEAGQLALDAANWLVTRGDSDIDRPW